MLCILCCAVLCADSLQESDYIGAASNQEVHVCVLPEGISLTPAVHCAACRAVLMGVLSWRQLLSVHNFVSGGFTSTELPVHDQFFAPPGHTELALSLPAVPGSRYTNTTLCLCVLPHMPSSPILPHMPSSPILPHMPSSPIPSCLMLYQCLCTSLSAFLAQANSKHWCIPAFSNAHTHTLCGLSMCWLMQEATLFKFALYGEPNCSVLAADVLSFLWRCTLGGCGWDFGAGLTSTPLLQVGKCRSLSALCFPPGVWEVLHSLSP